MFQISPSPHQDKTLRLIKADLSAATFEVQLSAQQVDARETLRYDCMCCKNSQDDVPGTRLGNLRDQNSLGILVQEFWAQISWCQAFGPVDSLGFRTRRQQTRIPTPSKSFMVRTNTTCSQTWE